MHEDIVSTVFGSDKSITANFIESQNFTPDQNTHPHREPPYPCDIFLDNDR
ncbi:MAG TPA: hypothetical protein VHX38_04125 [Pseudonocardiaceae bacterium]|nr:hypothetical protein [Pseudonocardiaceae bacterium]